MLSSRAVAYLHQPRFRRPHGQLRSVPASRRRRRCRHPPSWTKSWAVAGRLHPYGRAAGVQLRLQPGPDPHRQPSGAVCANERDQCLHGRHPPRIRRRAPPARRTAVGPSGGARADARGTAARPRPSCGAGRGRSRRRQRTRDRLRRIVAGLGPGAGQGKAGRRPGLPPYFPSPDGPATSATSGRPASRARTRCRAVAGQICIASSPGSGCPEGRRGDRCHAGTGGGRRHRPATALRRALARS